MVVNRIVFAHALRGLAAATVVASHLAYLIWREPDVITALIAYPSMATVIRNIKFIPITDFGLAYFWGHFGVALFFIISGFVIPFSVASTTRAGFAVARVLRIWPTYLAGLAIAIFCVVINSGLSGKSFPYSSAEILLNALIVTRWPTSTLSIDGIVWTLEIEMFFYAACLAVMPLIKCYDQRLFALTSGTVLLAYFDRLYGEMLLRLCGPLHAIAGWMATMSVYVSFMLCGTAFYFHYRSRVTTVRLVAIQCCLVSSFVIATRLGRTADQGWTAPIVYLVAGCIFTLSYFGRDHLAALPAVLLRPMLGLAEISYPLYAVHGVLGYTIVVHTIERGAPAWVSVILALVVVLTLAIALHFAVELPSQSYGKSLAARLQLPLKNTLPTRRAINPGAGTSTLSG